MSQKISSLKNFARVAANKENDRGLQELLEKAVLTWQKLPIVVFATSVYYTCKQPTSSSKSYYCKWQLSLLAMSMQTCEMYQYCCLDLNMDM